MGFDMRSAWLRFRALWHAEPEFALLGWLLLHYGLGPLCSQQHGGDWYAAGEADGRLVRLLRGLFLAAANGVAGL